MNTIFTIGAIYLWISIIYLSLILIRIQIAKTKYGNIVNVINLLYKPTSLFSTALFWPAAVFGSIIICANLHIIEDKEAEKRSIKNQIKEGYPDLDDNEYDALCYISMMPM